MIYAPTGLCLGLTHWGRVTHICVGNITIVDSDNGLSPERRQAIIWTNAGILLIGPLGTNFSEILIESQTFSLKKMRLKMSSASGCSFRLGLNVLNTTNITMEHFCRCIHVGIRYGKTTPKETLYYYLYDCMDSYVHKQAGRYVIP